MSRRVVDNYRYLAPSSSEISPVAGPLIRRRSKMTFDTIHSTCLFGMPIPLKLKAASFTLSPHSSFGGLACTALGSGSQIQRSVFLQPCQSVVYKMALKQGFSESFGFP